MTARVSLGCYVYYNQFAHHIRIVQRKLHCSFTTHRVPYNMSPVHPMRLHKSAQVFGQYRVRHFFQMWRAPVVALIYDIDQEALR